MTPAIGCRYCCNGRMPLDDTRNFHLAKDGRRYACGLAGRKPANETGAALLDAHSQLQAKVDFEVAPPWIRHPVPWDNVVVRAAGSTL